MKDPASIARTKLLEALLHNTPAIKKAQITRIDLAPGQAAGLHRHPCHVIGVVLDGKIRFQIADDAARILAVGDAFHEPEASVIQHFDNASDTEPASFLACYLLPPGEEELIEMLEPDQAP